MRILVSNDDGIYSPGIAALAEVASEFGTVRIVAPNMEQSSMGHAIHSIAAALLPEDEHPEPDGLPRERHASGLRGTRCAQLGEGSVVSPE